MVLWLLFSVASKRESLDVGKPLFYTLESTIESKYRKSWLKDPANTPTAV